MPAWLEAGRREVFRVLTPDLSFGRWRVALVNTNIDFRGQLYFQEDAVVRTWVERVGGKSFTLYEEIWQGEGLCVTATATYVCFNYETQQAEPVPDDARAAFAAHMKEAS